MERGFADRTVAGRVLGAELAGRSWVRPVVLALPRGGVPVGAGVAAALGVPLDVVVARKVGAPGQPELAVGAVTADGSHLFDDDMLDALGLTRADLADRLEAETAEARRRQERYASGELPPLRERDVIVVDDGLATGSTALAAIHAVRAATPRSVTMAVPVGSHAAVRRLQDAADAVVCLLQPLSFRSVGQWYRDFRQVSDEQVDALVG